MRNSFISATEGSEHQPHIAMEVRNAAVQGDCLADQIKCLLVAAGMIGDDAEKVQAIDMAGLERQNLAVQWLGLGGAAGPVQGRRLGEDLINIQHCLARSSYRILVITSDASRPSTTCFGAGNTWICQQASHDTSVSSN